MRQLVLCVAAAVVMCCGNVLAQPEQPTSGAAMSYLNHALDVMQQNSLHRKSIDWVKLRQETLDQAAGSQSSADTYEAIRSALQKLGDHHSFLQLSSAELQAKDKEARERRHDLRTPSGPGEKWPPSPYIDRRIPGGSIQEIAGAKIASVVVPLLTNPDDGQMHVYADTLGKTIAALAEKHPAGWIIDLRGNLGGNMWPMLAGVGPLEGPGVLGSYVDADNNKDTWFYEADGAGAHMHTGGRTILCWVPSQPVSFKTPPIVAVLIDHGTASSGEAIAVSFQGRPLSKSFGRFTHGQTTSNDGFLLEDGANLVLTTGVEADRTGKIYLDGINPDVELPEESHLPNAGTVDPMTAAAAAWIISVAGQR